MSPVSYRESLSYEIIFGFTKCCNVPWALFYCLTSNDKDIDVCIDVLLEFTPTIASLLLAFMIRVLYVFVILSVISKLIRPF